MTAVAPNSSVHTMYLCSGVIQVLQALASQYVLIITVMIRLWLVLLSAE